MKTWDDEATSSQATREPMSSWDDPPAAATAEPMFSWEDHTPVGSKLPAAGLAAEPTPLPVQLSDYINPPKIPGVMPNIMATTSTPADRAKASPEAFQEDLRPTTDTAIYAGKVIQSQVIGSAAFINRQLDKQGAVSAGTGAPGVPVPAPTPDQKAEREAFQSSLEQQATSARQDAEPYAPKNPIARTATDVALMMVPTVIATGVGGPAAGVATAVAQSVGTEYPSTVSELSPNIGDKEAARHAAELAAAGKGTIAGMVAGLFFSRIGQGEIPKALSPNTLKRLTAWFAEGAAGTGIQAKSDQIITHATRGDVKSIHSQVVGTADDWNEFFKQTASGGVIGMLLGIYARGLPKDYEHQMAKLGLNPNKYGDALPKWNKLIKVSEAGGITKDDALAAGIAIGKGEGISVGGVDFTTNDAAAIHSLQRDYAAAIAKQAAAAPEANAPAPVPQGLPTPGEPNAAQPPAESPLVPAPRTTTTPPAEQTPAPIAPATAATPAPIVEDERPIITPEERAGLLGDDEEPAAEAVAPPLPPATPENIDEIAVANPELARRVLEDLGADPQSAALIVQNLTPQQQPPADSEPTAPSEPPPEVDGQFVIPGTEDAVADQQENERHARTLKKQDSSLSDDDAIAVVSAMRQSIADEMKQAAQEAANQGQTLEEYVKADGFDQIRSAMDEAIRATGKWKSADLPTSDTYGPMMTEAYQTTPEAKPQAKPPPPVAQTTPTQTAAELEKLPGKDLVAIVRKEGVVTKGAKNRTHVVNAIVKHREAKGAMPPAPTAESHPSQKYKLAQEEFKGLKSKLTRAVNSGNPDKIIATADEAMAIFEQKGYPDSWANWEREKSDAEWRKARSHENGLLEPLAPSSVSPRLPKGVEAAIQEHLAEFKKHNWDRQVRPSDPKLGSKVGGSTVVGVWRTATASEADGSLHLTLMRGDGERYGVSGKQAEMILRERKPTPKAAPIPPTNPGATDGTIQSTGETPNGKTDGNRTPPGAKPNVPSGGGSPDGDGPGPTDQHVQPSDAAGAPPASGQPGDQSQGADGSAGNEPARRGGGGNRPRNRGPAAGAKLGGSGKPQARGESRSQSVPELIAERRTNLPDADRNHRIGAEDTLIVAGAKGKARANLAAIRLYKQLLTEKRNPTPDEKKVLAQYTGWGQLANYFDRIKPERIARAKSYGRSPEEDDLKWEKEYGSLAKEIKDLLSPDDWDAAARSTQNAHYTSRDVITHGLWGIAQRLGFEGGNVLESSAGIGHIMGLIPDEIESKSLWTAVELDSTSSGILRLLYPESTVYGMGFQDAPVESNSFDLAITNVPFAAKGPHDPAYPNMALHNYMLAKNIDAVKPGGLVIAITSDSTMDRARSITFREWAQGRVDFVGAIRLPNDAFKKNAGTEVTTDILIFRKSDGKPFADRKLWLETREIGVPAPKNWNAEEMGEPPTTAEINQYFADHPDMMLGDMTIDGKMYRKTEGDDSKAQTLSPRKDQDTVALLDEAVRKLPQSVAAYDPLAPAIRKAVTGGEAGAAKEFSYQMKDGKVWQVQRGQLVEPHFAGSPGKTKLAKTLIGLRDHSKLLIDAQLNPAISEKTLETLRGKVNQAYDDFKATYGAINSRPVRQVFEDDPEYPLLSGLEYVDESVVEKPGKGGKVSRQITQDISKADILSKRTQYPVQAPEKADSPVDAMAISESWKGYLDIPYVAKLLGTTEEQAIHQMVDSGVAFRDPGTQQVVSRDEYLSGDVREKLRAAESAVEKNPDLQRNIDAMKAVIPADKAVSKIKINLGSPWVPPAVYQDWLSQLFERQDVATIGYVPETGQMVVQWNHSLKYDAKNTDTLAGGGVSATRLVELSLKMELPKVYDEWKEDGKVKRALNVERTEAAREQQKVLKDRFETWAKQSQHAPQIARLYNDKYNAHVERTFSLPPFQYFPGQSTAYYAPRPHQARAVMRGIRESYTLAHEVGVGKTMAFITTVMEWKRLGLARKSMVVAMNTNVNQIIETFKRMYPQARILAPSERDFESSNRQRLFARIATGDYDAIILAHSQFNQIEDDPARLKAWVKTQLDKLHLAAVDAGGKGDESDKYSRDPRVKAVEERRQSLEEFLEKLAGRKTDNVVPFEKMGIDGLIVDEAHFYKKVYFDTQLENVRGLDTDFSQRGLSLLMKIRHVQQRTGGRNTILATGTPLTNTLAEAWNIMRLVRPDLMEKWGISNFDDFAASFAQIAANVEMDSVGRWREILRMGRFENAQQLSRMFRQTADVVFADEVPEIVRPQIKGGNAITHEIEPGPQLKEIMQKLLKIYEWYEKLKGQEKRMNRHIPLVIDGRAKKAALDVRMLRPDAQADEPSKIGHMAKEVARIYDATENVRGAQVIFADLYRSDQKETFNLFAAIRDELVKLGILNDEIALSPDFAGTSKLAQARRLQLFNDVNSGNVRVVLGTTAGLGVGVNIQTRLAAAHHLDAPYRPADIEQREGRIVRQGNLFGGGEGVPEGFLAHGGIELHRYGMKQTFDAGAYQRLARKQRMVREFIAGTLSEDSVEDMDDSQALSFEQASAAFSGNPLTLRRFELMKDIQRLQAIKNAHIDSMASARYKKQDLARTNDNYRREIEKVTELIKENPATFNTDDFPGITVAGKTYADMDEAQEALDAILKKEAAKHRAAADDPDTRIRRKEKGEISYPLGDWKFGTMPVKVSSVTEYDRNGSLIGNPGLEYSAPNPTSARGFLKTYTTAGGFLRGLMGLRNDYRDIVPDREAFIAQNAKAITELDKALTRRFEQEGDLEKGRAELREVVQKLGAASDPNKMTREDLNEFIRIYDEAGGAGAPKEAMLAAIGSVRPEKYEKVVRWLGKQRMTPEAAGAVHDLIKKLDENNRPPEDGDDDGNQPKHPDGSDSGAAQGHDPRPSPASPKGISGEPASQGEIESAFVRSTPQGATVERRGGKIHFLMSDGAVVPLHYVPRSQMPHVPSMSMVASITQHSYGLTVYRNDGTGVAIPATVREFIKLPKADRRLIVDACPSAALYHPGEDAFYVSSDDAAASEVDEIAREEWGHRHLFSQTATDVARIESEFEGLTPYEAFEAAVHLAMEVPQRQWPKGIADILGRIQRGIGSGQRQSDQPPMPAPAGSDQAKRQRMVTLAAVGAGQIGRGSQRFSTWARVMQKQFPGISNRELAFTWRQARRYKAMTEDAKAEWVKRHLIQGGEKTVKETIAENTGRMNFGEAVSEVDALRASLRAQQRAAKGGYNAALDDSTNFKERLVRIVQGFLPPSQRHAMLLDVARAHTIAQMRLATAHLYRVLARYETRQALSDLETMTGKVRLDAKQGPKNAPLQGPEEKPELPWAKIDRDSLERDLRDRYDKIMADAKIIKAGLETATTAEEQYHAIDAFHRLTDDIRAVGAEQVARKFVRVGNQRIEKEKIVSDLIEKIEPGGPGDGGAGGYGGSNERPGDASVIRRWLGRGSLSMETIMLHLDPKEGLPFQTAIEQVRRGQEGFHGEERDWNDRLVQALKAAGVDAGTAKLDRFVNQAVSVNLPDAGKLSITRNNIVGLVAAAGDRQTSKLIERGAVWNFRGNPLGSPIKLTMQDMAALEGMISPDERGLIRAFKDYNEQKITQRLMQKSIELRGKAPDPVKGYFPRSRNLQQNESKGEPRGWRGVDGRAVEEITNLQERSPDLTQPLYIPEFIQDTDRYVENVARVIHLAEPVRGAAMVLENPRVKAALERRFGKSMNLRIQQFLEDTMQVRLGDAATGGEKLAGLITRNASRAWLQANPNPVLKNVFAGTTSLIDEFELADWKMGAVKMFSPAVFDQMIKSSPIAWARYHGGLYGQYSPITGRHVETAIQLTAGEALKVGKLGAAVDRLPFMEWADSVPLRAAFAAAHAEARRLHPTWTPEQQNRYALDKFHRAIYRTQNGTSSTEISGLASGARRNRYASAAFLFTSDSNKKYNMVARLRGARGHKKARAAAAVASSAFFSTLIGVGTATGLTMLGAWLAGRGLSDEEKKKFKDEAVWDLLRNTFGPIYFADTALGFLRDIGHGQGGIELTIAPQEVAKQFIDSVGRFGIAMYKWAEAASDTPAADKAWQHLKVTSYRLVDHAQTIVGAPTEPLTRMGHQVYDAATAKPPDPRDVERQAVTEKTKALRASLPPKTQRMLQEMYKLRLLGADKLTSAERARHGKLEELGKAWENLQKAEESKKPSWVESARQWMARESERLQAAGASPN